MWVPTRPRSRTPRWQRTRPSDMQGLTEILPSSLCFCYRAYVWRVEVVWTGLAPAWGA